MADADDALTPGERDLVRREFRDLTFAARSIHDGILVKRWATGARKGEPKPTAAVQSMLDRGLLAMEDDGRLWLTARFTPRGLAALRRLAEDRRALPPEEFSRLLADLAGAG